MKTVCLSFLALALASPLAAHPTNEASSVAPGAAEAQASANDTPPPAAQAPGQHDASVHAIPRIVKDWESAWNTGDSNRMAALFTTDGSYQDFSLGYRFQGRAEIAKFIQESIKNVADLHVRVTDAFRTNDRIAVRFVFTGHVNGAPKAFSVPVLTVMELKGEKITYDGDYYNRLEVLRQSGLPKE